MNWLVQSLLAVLLVTPAWLAISFFDKNYKVKSDVFLIFYMIGIIAGVVFAFPFSGRSPLVLSWKIALLISLIGLVFGAGANILIFRATASAPNPGLALAILNSSSILVFLTSAALGKWKPEYFGEVKIDFWQFIGIILAITGVSIIAIRRQ